MPVIDIYAPLEPVKTIASIIARVPIPDKIADFIVRLFKK